MSELLAQALKETHEVFDKCDGYLDARTGTYEYRCKRYDAVVDNIHRHVGLEADMTIADIAAGWTEFGHRLTERGFRGRYIPYDGAIDGKDLQYWVPPLTQIDVCVAIEFLEHIKHPERLVQTMFDKAEKMVVITTPNSDVVDTLAMDEDHVTEIFATDLYDMGFDGVREHILFPGSKWNPESKPDTLVAWKKL